jgi:hypothetical protein
MGGEKGDSARRIVLETPESFIRSEIMTNHLLLDDGTSHSVTSSFSYFGRGFIGKVYNTRFTGVPLYSRICGVITVMVYSILYGMVLILLLT